MYCINFYSGSPEDVDAVSVFISGRSQFQMSISDHEFENININKEDYVRQRIIAAVHQRVQSQASKARLFKALMKCYNTKFFCVLYPFSSEPSRRPITLQAPLYYLTSKNIGETKWMSSCATPQLRNLPLLLQIWTMSRPYHMRRRTLVRAT